MGKPILLTPHLTRVVSHYKKFDLEVPRELLDGRPVRPDLRDFPYPLPRPKQAYVCSCAGEGGVKWFGADGGVTRYDPYADSLADVVQYCSAPRDLLDNNVQNLLADGTGVWVLTESGATHIDMTRMSAAAKAELLLRATLTIVDRRGMVSQRALSEARNLASAVPYGHSDNDGGFTALFAIGEIFHYETLRREYGDYDRRTLAQREVACRASEGALLLMYIAGRGNGFVARSYVTKNEPVPDDGLFFKKNGATAYCLNTAFARQRRMVGVECPADSPIPERLRKLYADEGYEDDDITYKGDTSSDEITFHYLHLLVAHEFLGREDAEYDTLLRTAAVNTMTHIIDNGFTLHDATDEPTTWAKWNPEYFATPDGYADAALNSAEVMMYLRVTMRLTGEEGRWKKAYDHLLSIGYGDLPMQHFDRFHQVCMSMHVDDREEMMYGDHGLAVAAFWGLITLEPDPELKEKFRRGFRSWLNTIEPEYNPGYYFLYMLSDPDNADPDEERIRTWFARANVSRLAAGVSLDRRVDIPARVLRGGALETSALLAQDERFISKYDRDPYDYKNEDSGGVYTVECCTPYTFAYWLGRYFKFIEEADA